MPIEILMEIRHNIQARNKEAKKWHGAKLTEIEIQRETESG